MKRKSGFTLVELLVVIGIIAVLISLILPAMQRARDKALAISCLSNMRQVYIDYLLYANEFKNYVPCGFAWSDKSNSNIVKSYVNSSPSSGCALNIGWVYYAGLIKNTRIYYCPADESQPYKASDWPLSFKSYASFRVGYAMRPESRWWDNATTAYPNYVNTSLTSQSRLAKLTDLRSKAFISEAGYFSAPATMTQQFVAGRHKTGMNVVFADGSGAFVPHSYFKKNMTLEDANKQHYYILNDPNGDPGWNDKTKPYEGIWADFEAAH